jgi:dGTPase
VNLIRRTELEQRERASLAPYAALTAESRGRVYPQKEHRLRTAFQRDRDRIVHSAAFRRMEYKTQVFLPHEADHFRTRLTHTLEVAQISRTLARNLRVNEDLTEAIALVHDLGHTPFGHSGEDVLSELLKDLGGFNHNRQSLRVVDLLEQRYPEHPGLNLTYEVREGIAKHETKVAIDLKEFASERWPTLEASLVDRADEIAYNAHDIDDGINSGLITLDDIRPLLIWMGADGSPALSLPANDPAGKDQDQDRHRLVRYLIDRMATDLLKETDNRIKKLGISDLQLLRTSPSPICGYTEDMERRVIELKEFLHSHLYRHPRLMRHANQTKKILEALYENLVAAPERMPQRFQEMLAGERTEIVVVDYIAGMTDRYAEKLYEKIS